MDWSNYGLSCSIHVVAAIFSSMFSHIGIIKKPNKGRQKMIDRVFRNWKTSVIGLLLIVISFIFVWYGKATLTEVSLFLSGGFALLFMKDTNK